MLGYTVWENTRTKCHQCSSVNNLACDPNYVGSRKINSLIINSDDKDFNGVLPINNPFLVFYCFVLLSFCFDGIYRGSLFDMIQSSRRPSHRSLETFVGQYVNTLGLYCRFSPFKYNEFRKVPYNQIIKQLKYTDR